jgi:hypothetical protein
MTIHESFPSAAQSWSVVGCVQSGFYASNAYREIVVGAATATTTPGPSTGSTKTAPSDSSSAPVETGAANTPQTNSPASETNSPSPETNSPSQAWIAGAVIGPVAAIALVGFLVFWLRRRRGSNNETAESHAGYQESETTKTQSVWSPEMPTCELAGGAVATELADHRPFELDSSPIGPYGVEGYMDGRTGRG